MTKQNQRRNLHHIEYYLKKIKTVSEEHISVPSTAVINSN